MKEHPILFSESMVLAILEGRKTQTRRQIKAPKGLTLGRHGSKLIAFDDEGGPARAEIKRPFAVGDRLWVQEAFASGVPGCPGGWASRITLEVTDIRPERVQAITEADAKAEGLTCLSKDGGATYKYGIPDRDGWPGTGDIGWEWKNWETDPRKAFHRLWDSVYGRGPFGWQHNPWVWAVTFKRVEEATK